MSMKALRRCLEGRNSEYDPLCAHPTFGSGGLGVYMREIGSSCPLAVSPSFIVSFGSNSEIFQSRKCAINNFWTKNPRTKNPRGLLG